MITLCDTTLRDGTQGEGVALTVQDRLRITSLLDDFGVHLIEGGWPGSNPEDAEHFRQVRRLPLRRDERPDAATDRPEKPREQNRAA